jgi:hypothetical protein
MAVELLLKCRLGELKERRQFKERRFHWNNTKSVNGRSDCWFHWRSSRNVDWTSLRSVDVDSNRGGVSIVDYVTDGFWGEITVVLRNYRLWGCGSYQYVTVDFRVEIAVILRNYRFRGYASCQYVTDDLGGEAAIDLRNCRFWGDP